jgi:hypothetical protein
MFSVQARSDARAGDLHLDRGTPYNGVDSASRRLQLPPGSKDDLPRHSRSPIRSRLGCKHFSGLRTALRCSRVDLRDVFIAGLPVGGCPEIHDAAAREVPVVKPKLGLTSNEQRVHPGIVGPRSLASIRDDTSSNHRRTGRVCSVEKAPSEVDVKMRKAGRRRHQPTFPTDPPENE